MTVATTTERADWLAWRRDGIGASDVAGILGVSPWASPWSVWANKTGLLPDSEPSSVQERGQFLELSIGPWFEKRTGLTVAGEQQQCEHPDNSVHRCTLDGLVFESLAASIGYDPDAPLGGIEMKASSRPWDAIPAHYQTQGQWQMYVRNLERVWFAVMTNWDLHIYELVRDDDDIEFMVARVNEFHERYVLTGTPPPTDGSEATLSALAQVYPQHVDGKSVALDELAGTFKLWRQGKADLKFLEEVADGHKAKLLAAMGDAEIGTINGEIVLTNRQQEKQSVSAKTLQAQHPRIAKKQIKKSTFRVLREVTQKGAK